MGKLQLENCGYVWLHFDLYLLMQIKNILI